MMAISVRRAVETDQAAIESLVWSAAVNPRDIRWRRFLVAEKDGRIVGVQQVRVHRGGTREVASRVVLPQYRRRGIGTELMRVSLAGESGPLYVQCSEKWAPYYERFGFRRVELSELPPDLRKEHRIARVIVALRSLYLRRRLSVVPMERSTRRSTPATHVGKRNVSRTPING